MNLEIAQKWYRQARHDLEMAGKNAAIGGYDVAAFLCQQSIEKLLKSVLILETGTSPKTHYLDEICDLLNLEDELRGEVLDFSADYMIARYPDVSDHVPYEEYTSDVALDKVERCKNIFARLSIRIAPLQRPPDES
jgi:HEPN domain-containing protein